MIETAVVILNYNGRNYLEKFLPSVIKHSEEAEIFVVDNASTDDSVDFLKLNFSDSDLNLICLESNKGFTGGYNEALKSIDAEICVLLNSDVEVTKGWLLPVISIMKQDISIAACQPKILSFKEKNRFEYAGAAGGYIDYLGFPFCRGRIFKTLELDEGQYDDIQQIFWASGACLFLRRQAFYELGGFDEDYFAHMEEIDLCWRLQNAGHKIYYIGQSTVYHVGGGTLSSSNPRKTYLNFRNGLSMFIKNEESGKLWWKLPARTVLDMVAAIKFTLADSWKDGLSVLKAHIHFWASLHRNLDKRNETKEKWLLKKPELQIYRGLIVFDYFLKGRKSFKRIKGSRKDFVEVVSVN